MKARRKPTMASALATLLHHGVTVGAVLDVGVLTGTKPLIEVFPKLKHYLFEPVNLHLQKIEKNYRKIDYVLQNVAVSDVDGIAYLACRSIRRDGKISHADVVEKPVTASEVKGLVSCDEIPQARLDTLVDRESPTTPYLLKIDVDGQELKVLSGAQATLLNTSIVVIEAPLNRVMTPQFFARSKVLMDSGFFLMDIVDMAYYDGVLWQVDLIFVREDVVKGIPALQPFQHPDFEFEADKWNPLGV